MRSIDTFIHGGVAYEFVPPVSVPDGREVATIGQLVECAHLNAPLHSVPFVAKTGAAAMGRLAETQMTMHPEYALATLQATLRRKHQVSVK